MHLMAGLRRVWQMKPECKKVDRLTLLITTFLGSGLLPKMPGTYGSFFAAVVVFPLTLVLPMNLLLLFSIAVFFMAIPFINKAMTQSETEDPGWIVIDEVAGQWLAFAFIPLSLIKEQPWLLLLGFILFRFFDILKPLGIHHLEKLPKAWGVMADDMLGGLYTGIILTVFANFVLM